MGVDSFVPGRGGITQLLPDPRQSPRRRCRRVFLARVWGVIQKSILNVFWKTRIPFSVKSCQNLTLVKASPPLTPLPRAGAPPLQHMYRLFCTRKAVYNTCRGFITTCVARFDRAQRRGQHGDPRDAVD